MKNPGAPEPLYIAARRVLLNALEALGKQQQAVILVGAQAIYLQVGEADLAVPPFTTDADIALDPNKLSPNPNIEEAMRAAGFKAGNQPGAWLGKTTSQGATVEIPVDLMVPDSIGGPGRRAARLTGHGTKAARKARGLEAALVDHKTMEIASLEQKDSRIFSIAVASPAALLVAKLHKIGERVDAPQRQNAKDSLDVFRILRGTSTDELAKAMQRLSEHKFSSEVTKQALNFLKRLFADKKGIGLELTAASAAPLMAEAEVKESCLILAQSLINSTR